jgi:hypothetical protein
LQGRKRAFRIVVLWRSTCGKSDWSNSETPAPTEIEAVGESEFEAKPAS